MNVNTYIVTVRKDIKAVIINDFVSAVEVACIYCLANDDNKSVNILCYDSNFISSPSKQWSHKSIIELGKIIRADKDARKG